MTSTTKKTEYNKNIKEYKEFENSKKKQTIKKGEKTKITNAIEKLIPSVLNAIIAFGLATPILVFYGPSIIRRISVVLFFGLYETYIFVFQEDRCFGMKIMDTYREESYTNKQHILYNVLYIMSFSTAMIYVWFPGDLLIINILCIQLPMVILTKNTLHGYVSGMRTAKWIHKKETKQQRMKTL